MLARSAITFAENPWAITLGFIGFVLLWMAAMKLLARQSGWSLLARKYAGKGSFAGRLLGCRSICSSRGGSYGGCVEIWVSDRAIVFSPGLFLRPAHQILVIPWTDVTEVVRHPTMPGFAGVSFAGSSLAFYFDENEIAPVREAWEKSRGAHLESQPS